jgi:hypothetical protein
MASQDLLKDTSASRTINLSNKLTWVELTHRNYSPWMKHWPRRLQKQMEALSIKIIMAIHRALQTKHSQKMQMALYTSFKRTRCSFRIWKTVARDSSFRVAHHLWKWKQGRATRYLHLLMLIRMRSTRGRKSMPVGEAPLQWINN